MQDSGNMLHEGWAREINKSVKGKMEAGDIDSNLPSDSDNGLKQNNKDGGGVLDDPVLTSAESRAKIWCQ